MFRVHNLIFILIILAACSTPAPEEAAFDCPVADSDADVKLEGVFNGESLLVNINSKLEEDQDGKISIQLMDFNGEDLGSESVDIVLKAGMNNQYLEVPKLDINFSEIVFNYMIVKYESEDGSQRSSDNVYFVSDDELKLSAPDIDIDVQPILTGYKVRLISPVLVKNVKLTFPNEGVWSENCFDLLPNKLGEYYFSTPEYTPGLEDSLEISYLNSVDR